MTKINNIPNYNPSSEDTFFSFITQIIKNYLKNNLFTVNVYKIVAVNKTSVNIAPVVKRQQTNGTIIDITSKDYINNVPVLYIGGSINKTTFNLSVGDYGVGISFKNNCNSYINNGVNPISDNNLFNIMNMVFIPLSNQIITENTIINNNGTQIELTNSQINLNKNINITGNNEATSYSTGGISGVSGTFTDTGTGASGMTLTITNGLITNIA